MGADIERELERLSGEREKHQKAVLECSGQRRKLQKSFNEMKLERSKKVDSILEKNFLDQSEKGLIDKILTTTIKEPKLNQLNDNIAKLQTQEEWHRKKLGEISRDENKQKGLLKKGEVDKAAKECHEHYETFADLYFKAEDAFDKFRHSIVRARNLDPAFSTGFKDMGINDAMFQNIIDQKLRGGVVKNITMAVFVDSVSRSWRYDPDSIWYDNPSFPKRRLKENTGSISRKRDSWK